MLQNAPNLLESTSASFLGSCPKMKEAKGMKTAPNTSKHPLGVGVGDKHLIWGRYVAARVGSGLAAVPHTNYIAAVLTSISSVALIMRLVFSGGGAPLSNTFFKFGKLWRSNHCNHWNASSSTSLQSIMHSAPLQSKTSRCLKLFKSPWNLERLVKPLLAYKYKENACFINPSIPQWNSSHSQMLICLLETGWKGVKLTITWKLVKPENHRWNISCAMKPLRLDTLMLKDLRRFMFRASLKVASSTFSFKSIMLTSSRLGSPYIIV
ncbi:uncharacterized protein LOC131249375 isoform X2 [Magnolia sinica]|uniref:uncharacterized protein LOC131249375 isoform X2 n=1 Tax=Magnolia sinica TaxID=86752 RepID=UPI002657E83A|nr:uncharacterized protein LOC131249375 isoform X2 [Magnolia sinica]